MKKRIIISVSCAVVIIAAAVGALIYKYSYVEPNSGLPGESELEGLSMRCELAVYPLEVDRVMVFVSNSDFVMYNTSYIRWYLDRYIAGEWVEQGDSYYSSYSSRNTYSSQLEYTSLLPFFDIKDVFFLYDCVEWMDVGRYRIRLGLKDIGYSTHMLSAEFEVSDDLKYRKSWEKSELNYYEGYMPGDYKYDITPSNLQQNSDVRLYHDTEEGRIYLNKRGEIRNLLTYDSETEKKKEIYASCFMLDDTRVLSYTYGTPIENDKNHSEAHLVLYDLDKMMPMESFPLGRSSGIPHPAWAGWNLWYNHMYNTLSLWTMEIIEEADRKDPDSYDITQRYTHYFVYRDGKFDYYTDRDAINRRLAKEAEQAP